VDPDVSAGDGDDDDNKDADVSGGDKGVFEAMIRFRTHMLE
jgi:hypothetical protein